VPLTQACKCVISPYQILRAVISLQHIFILTSSLFVRCLTARKTVGFLMSPRNQYTPAR